MLSDNQIQGLLTLANIETLQWHANLFFRQSGSQLNFFRAYSDKVTRIAKSALPALQTLYPKIKSIALIASHQTKSRAMPSFASDPETEMKLVRQHSLKFGSRSQRYDTNHICLNVARSTFAMTNQLLRSTIEGKRPILVSMGTNSISSNWERTYEFVQRYHTQYAELIIIVRVIAAEMNDLDRTASLRVLCPYDIDGQSFGIYTSTEFLQDELCQGLLERNLSWVVTRKSLSCYTRSKRSSAERVLSGTKRRTKTRARQRARRRLRRGFNKALRGRKHFTVL